MKLLIKSIVLLLFFSASAQEQYSITSQKDRLQQYSGQWVSAITTKSDSLAMIPSIKMSSMGNMNNHSLSVEVFQKDKNSQYHCYAKGRGKYPSKPISVLLGKTHK